MFSVLGLSLEEEGLLDEEIEGLIQQRIQARKDRNLGYLMKFVTA